MIPSVFDLSQWQGLTAALVPELFLGAWTLVLTLVGGMLMVGDRIMS